ncbi:MAG: hypothetical protein HN712_25205 [Gemmatimonadetes bacterium]|jgi:hypothetical protein|nr:hypothetical protein [Gemmatimonadota bacterium]MBT7863639.1 hypothetical protein [Gemmatimonadota bacterium]
MKRFLRFAGITSTPTPYGVQSLSSQLMRNGAYVAFLFSLAAIINY